MNKVIITGNLTRDVGLKYTPSGSPVATIGVANNERGKDLKDIVTFIDVEVWGKTAENCDQYLSKGSPVLIDGRLKLDQWTQQDGQKRNKLKIVANRVQFLGNKQTDEGDQNSEVASQETSHEQAPDGDDTRQQVENLTDDDENLPF